MNQNFLNIPKQNESLILYKLVILYMLEQVDFPLSNSQLTEFITMQDMASYFTIQQTISELTDTALIQAEQVRNSTLYTLTAEGIQTLEYYRNLIPEDVITEITKYLKENKLKLKENFSVRSTYEASKTKDLNAHFTITEKNNPVFQLTISVPDEALAEKMCQNWEKHYEEIYSHIMTTLMSDA